MAFIVHHADFIKGAIYDKDFPVHESIEIAFLGRSNVGKSTLLNRLTGTKKLAKTSKTPGRTQELNFFSIKGMLDEKPVSFVLCDLPGYGFARIPPAKKKILGESISKYIATRAPLTVVALLIDIRRGPQAEELAIRDMIYGADATVLPVLTKADKLSKMEIKKQSVKIANALSLEPSDLVITGTKYPTATLWARLLEAR
jgi:GTP-binding protein